MSSFENFDSILYITDPGEVIRSSVCNRSNAFMNSSRGVFRPSKLDGLRSQFTLKSMFTRKQLVSKKIQPWQTRNFNIVFFQTLSLYWRELLTYSWLLLALNSRGASSVVMLYLRKKASQIYIYNNSLLIDLVKPSVSIFFRPPFMVKIRPPSHARFWNIPWTVGGQVLLP